MSVCYVLYSILCCAFLLFLLLLLLFLLLLLGTPNDGFLELPQFAFGRHDDVPVAGGDGNDPSVVLDHERIDLFEARKTPSECLAVFEIPRNGIVFQINRVQLGQVVASGGILQRQDRVEALDLVSGQPQFVQLGPIRHKRRILGFVFVFGGSASAIGMVHHYEAGRGGQSVAAEIQGGQFWKIDFGIPPAHQRDQSPKSLVVESVVGQVQFLQRRPLGVQVAQSRIVVHHRGQSVGLDVQPHELGEGFDALQGLDLVLSQPELFQAVESRQFLRGQLANLVGPQIELSQIRQVLDALDFLQLVFLPGTIP